MGDVLVGRGTSQRQRRTNPVGNFIGGMVDRCHGLHQKLQAHQEADQHKKVKREGCYYDFYYYLFKRKYCLQEVSKEVTHWEIVI